MSSVAVVFVIVALAVGFAIGWFFGGRETAAARAERDARTEDFRKAVTDLAGAEERAKAADALRGELATIRDERDAARTDLAALRATFEAAQLSFTERRRELLEEKDTMSAQFAEVANKLLDGAQKSFLEQAQQRFQQAGESSEAKLKILLQPVANTLTRYEANLKEIENARTGAYEGIKQQILLMREGQERVANEANRLITALRSSSGTAGRWGEDQCRNVLERAGLQEGIDFDEQVSADETGDRARPDFIVRLPGDRRLIIDVKCSLDAYVGATETDDEAIRRQLLAEHAKAIRTHAQSLSRRDYQKKFKRAIEFVVMFVPGENFLQAAFQEDQKLLQWSQNSGVIIVGPVNLISLTLNVASLRGQEKFTKRAEEVAIIGRKLYDNLNTLGKNAHATSKSIRAMISNWNSLVATLDGSLLSSARKFDELGVGKASQDVRDLEPLDGLVRDPQKLLSPVSSLTEVSED